MLIKTKSITKDLKILKQNTTFLEICKLDIILNSKIHIWAYSTKCLLDPV